MATLPPLTIDFSKADFVTLPLSTAQAAVMPVVVRRPDGGLVGLGTAFSIGPGLLLTAWHVMQDAIEHQHALAEGATTGVVYVAPGSDAATQDLFGGLLPIRNARYNQALDIALLEVMVPFIDDEPIPLPSLPLTVEIPRLGDQVVALGYSRLDTSKRQEGKAEDAYELQEDFNATRGTVEQVHPIRRDWLLPFPCFQTNARFDHGISGGPVFNTSGYVCGVVCSGYNFAPEAESKAMPEQTGYASYASLLYPAFVLEATRTEEGEERMYSLLELVREGTVRGHESLSRMEVTTDTLGHQQITLH